MTEVLTGSPEREVGTGADVVGFEAKERVIPVVVEELSVEKVRRETGGVRVRTSVEERQEVVDEPLEQETIEVERVQIGRVVDRPVPTRQEGDVTIVSVTKEILVVEKRLVLTEEVRITRRKSEYRAPQTITVRSEAVEVERLPGANAPTIESR